MPREMPEQTPQLFRARIEVTEIPPGREPITLTEWRGPFLTASPAKAAVTEVQRWAKRRNSRGSRNYINPGTVYTVAATVEVTDTVWRPLP